MFNFDRKNLIGLLNNHKIHISENVRKWLADGKSKEDLTYAISNQWTEEFIDKMIQEDSLDASELMDELDLIVKGLAGKDINDFAKDVKRKKN